MGLLVGQEDMTSCLTRRHVFLFNKKTSVRVEQEEKTCLLVQQEDISSCSTKRHVFFFKNLPNPYISADRR